MGFGLDEFNGLRFRHRVGAHVRGQADKGFSDLHVGAKSANAGFQGLAFVRAQSARKGEEGQSFLECDGFDRKSFRNSCKARLFFLGGFAHLDDGAVAGNSGIHRLARNGILAQKTLAAGAIRIGRIHN